METEEATIEYFHVFTDNKDDYFIVSQLGYKEAKKAAKEKIKQWKAEGYKNLRIYHSFDDEDGNTIEENCILCVGDYPY